MSIIIDGTETISGVSATGLTTAQNVGYAQLPTGSVLQIVNVANSSAATVSTQTYTDTNLSATITPKYSTSKILAIVHITGCKKEGGNGYLQAQLARNGTGVIEFEREGGYDNTTGINNFGGTGTSYLDSPATTSALTYKVQIRLGSPSGGSVSISNTSAQSTISLLEIAG